MKNPVFILALTFSLFLVLSHQLNAVEGTHVICQKCGSEITAEKKKFSVVQKGTSNPALFDDIGCALLWRESQCTSIQMSFDATATVYDFFTLDELPMCSAFFVKAANIHSPAGHGIAAFRDKEGAEKFIAHNGDGTILSYDDLLFLSLE